MDEVLERRAALLRARVLAERRATAEVIRRRSLAEGKRVLEVHSMREMLEAASSCPRNVCIVNVEAGEAWEN